MSHDYERGMVRKNPLDLKIKVELDRGFVVDSDPSRLDLHLVHKWLSTDTYWAIGRSYSAVEQAAEMSLNFGVYSGDGTQVGYSRLITDGVTIGWLCDVYIDREYRGKNLGASLAQAIVDAIEPLSLRRFMLSTSDAHEVYARVSLAQLPDPSKLMEFKPRHRKEDPEPEEDNDEARKDRASAELA